MQRITFEGVSKVLERGQVTIPKKIRERFGLAKNTYVGFLKQNGEILIRPLSASPSHKKSKEERDYYYWKGFKIYKAKYSREEALKILGRTKKILWTKEDEKSLKRMRKKEQERTKKVINWQSYWEK